MQKDIFKQDYFGTLFCVLVDESRKLMPEFTPTALLHQTQKKMCEAGTWINDLPYGVIIQSDPQESVVKLMESVLPEYRRLAANLIDQFINEYESQGGNRAEITEKFERMYIWRQ